MVLVRNLPFRRTRRLDAYRPQISMAAATDRTDLSGEGAIRYDDFLSRRSSTVIHHRQSPDNAQTFDVDAVLRHYGFDGRVLDPVVGTASASLESSGVG